MKQERIKQLFFIFIFLTLFSCTRDNDQTESNSISQENFIELSTAKKIGSEISFKSGSSATDKKTNAGIMKKIIESVQEIKNKNNNTVFYVINYIEGGYIVLSADNRIQPIIAFSEDDKFIVDEKAYSEGLKSWMNNSEKQITAIQNSNLKQTKENKLVWSQVQNTFTQQNIFAKVPSDVCYEHITIETKGPLITSTWEQSNGFNDALVYINCDGSNRHAYAGCVPIAMAQVMKYYQYPSNYNWTSMPSNSATSSTTNFILDIHNAIRNVYPLDPSYDCYSTGVSKYSNMAKILKTQFHYSSADISPYNYLTVKNNITAGKPVILSGFGNGGHMWICDGYQTARYYFDDCTGISTLYFHMNWGWEYAKNNGYFAYNNFTISDNQNYNDELEMIYNIKP